MDNEPGLLASLWLWLPMLLRGMLVNIEISVLAMVGGTMAGLAVGALTLSPWRPSRALGHGYVHVFRNSPALVLVYFTSYALPFEFSLGGRYFPFPDTMKVTLGLALAASAGVAVIFRAAVLSIPSGQWEAAQALALRRGQIYRRVLLPQCLRRMLPSWMNLYATITMATSLASLVGVHDLVDSAQMASNSVMRTDFTVLIYVCLLLIFFAYVYPIARYTRVLERRHAH